MEMRSRRVKANGLEHHVLEWNGGKDAAASATVLLVHGFADAAATWDDVARGIAERTGLRVVAADMRGFGDGPRVPAGAYYYFPDYVADVVAIADAIGASPLYLCGHSMGATIVTYVAGAFPERVAKLVLVDGVGPPDNPRDVAQVRMRRWIESMGTMKQTTFANEDEAAARIARFNPDADPAVLARRARQLLRPVDGGRFAWKHDPLHTTTSPMPFFAESYKSFAREVTCPTLHVSGGPRGYHVEDEDERLACFRTLKRVTIDGGHALHWTRPSELTDALAGFFAP